MGQLYPPAIFLMGPTASGKTELAIELALALDCEIISVDSAMVYRGMDIGTAKPSQEERRGVPHHLIDILDPAQAYSTGRFRNQALEVMREIGNRGRIPLLTGGTMLYFHALLHGLAELPAADPGIRRQIDEEAERRGWEALHRELRSLDPAAAARIHPNDPQRIQRALEVFRISGRSLSQLCAEAEKNDIPYQKISLVLVPENRAQLHQRIELRFLAMLEAGLIDEVQRLFDRGDLNESLPSIRAVGYRQAWSFLKGEYDREMMTERGVAATRQLAKRQFTWLRKQKNAHWYISGEKKLFRKVLRDVVLLLNKNQPRMMPDLL